MASKVPKPYNGGQWTAARYRSFIISILRAGSRKWPQKYEALKRALIGKRLDPKTGKMSNRYKCAACSNLFKADQVQVDHIYPVVDVKDGFVDWNTYIDRMYPEAERFQILCSECHSVKTQNERKMRKENASKD